MKSKNLFSYLLSAIALSGCLKISKKSDSAKAQEFREPQQLELVDVLSRHQVKMTYIPTTKPNIYDVELNWPRFNGVITILNDKKELLSRELTSQDEFLIQDLEGGLEKTIYLQTYKPATNLFTEIELKIMPPKDLVLSGTLVLRENTTLVANRIFITNDTKIHNTSHNLEITFSQLILGKNVLISPYPIDQRALPDTIGSDSGNIKIQGDQAYGNLTVYMNSEGGGNGSQGGVSCRSGWVEAMCQGYVGKNSGKVGSAIIELVDSTNLVLTNQVLRMPGGVGGAKYPGQGKDAAKICGNTPHSVIEANICNTPPVAGASATGGKICFKSSRESSYECKE